MDGQGEQVDINSNWKDDRTMEYPCDSLKDSTSDSDGSIEDYLMKS